MTRVERAIRRRVRDEVWRGLHAVLCNSDVPGWTVSGELDAVTDAILRMTQPAAIRRQTAEEIAQSLEAFATNDTRGRADMSIDRAAAIAREIGNKENS